MAEPWEISDSDIERARQEYESYLESYKAEEGEAEDDPKWWWGFIVWLQARFRQDVEVLGNKLVEGDISLTRWDAAMRERVRIFLIVCAVAGAYGDWDAIADRGTVQKQTREQFKYLEGFAEDIAEKRKAGEELTSAIPSRAKLYAGSLAAMYFLIRNEEEEKQGKTEAKWTLGQAEHCSDCLELAGEGWMPLEDLGGQVPGDGQTACGPNCQCHLEYRTVAALAREILARTRLYHSFLF